MIPIIETVENHIHIFHYIYSSEVLRISIGGIKMDNKKNIKNTKTHVKDNLFLKNDIRVKDTEFSEASNPREVTVKTDEGIQHFINTGSNVGKEV
jgi:hypothetical protein